MYGSHFGSKFGKCMGTPRGFKVNSINVIQIAADKSTKICQIQPLFAFNIACTWVKCNYKESTRCHYVIGPFFSWNPNLIIKTVNFIFAV